MNPFTRFLRQWNRDRKLDRLIEHCDALEALVVRVYKSGEATPADEAEYQAIRRWLAVNYREWEPALRLFWKQATVGGTPAVQDPFLRLIAVSSAREFTGNWEAMQNLPAAREALNRFILARSKETS